MSVSLSPEQEWRKRYEKSEKGKASRHRRKTSQAYKEKARQWTQTESGKESRRKSIKRYIESQKGKETAERHKSTEGYRETLLRNKHRRRARERNVPVIEIIDRSQVYKRDGGICQECFVKVEPDGWEMDHIIPLGPGNHTWTNVQVLCRSCNRHKVGTDKKELRDWREVIAEC